MFGAPAPAPAEPAEPAAPAAGGDDFGMMDAAPPAPAPAPAAADDFGMGDMAAPAPAAAADDFGGFDAGDAPVAAAPAPAPAPAPVEAAVPPKLQAFLDRQVENREKRKEVAAAKAAEMQEAAKVAMEGLETSRASTIEAKRKANLEADAAAKEFFASEANPWSKIVEYCDMKPKAQAKDAPKMKDTTRLRGMLLDLKHNPKE